MDTKGRRRRKKNGRTGRGEEMNEGDKERVRGEKSLRGVKRRSKRMKKRKGENHTSG